MVQEKPTIKEVDDKDEQSPVKSDPRKLSSLGKKHTKILEGLRIEIQPKTPPPEEEIIITDPIEYLKTYNGEVDNKNYLQCLKEGLGKIEKLKQDNEMLLNQLAEKVILSTN